MKNMTRKKDLKGEPVGNNYFDLDGDTEIDACESDVSDVTPLTWRGAQANTGSDWTIIVVTNELQTMSYHVHKSIVVFGPRKSKFLARSFRSQNKLEKTRSNSRSPKRNQNERSDYGTTKLELDQRDANNIPIVLDFMYAPAPGYTASFGESITACSSNLSYPSQESEFRLSILGDAVNTNNAVSLRHLCKIFEIDSLMLAVNKFIQKDLDFSTGPLYLSKAHEYKDERLIFSAQRLCTENVDKIDKNSLARLPFHLFRAVVKSLESFKEENAPLSLFLSEVVYNYLDKNPKSRSAETLVDLTDPLIMPHITSEAAIGYTTIIKNLDANEARKYWTDLVKLSRRCAKAVVKEYGWTDFSVEAAVNDYLGKTEEKENSKSFSVDRLLFATSFAAAVEQAQYDFDEMHKEQGQLLSIVSSLQGSLTSFEKALQQKNDNIEKEQKALAKAYETIASLKAEIGELRRKQKQRPNQNPNSPVRVNSTVERASPLRELVSPSRVGVDVYVNKQRSRDELQTRGEMRSRSLLSSLSLLSSP